MSAASDNNNENHAGPNEHDPGRNALVMIARLDGIAAYREQLRHAAGDGDFNQRVRVFQ